MLTYEYQKIAETYLGSNNYGGVYLKLYAKLNSQNTETNQSSVNRKSTLYIERGTAICGTTTTKGISGNGISTYSDNATGTYQTGENTLYEVAGTITHSDTGEAQATSTATFVSTPWSWNGSASATVGLPTIPRYATITSFTVSQRNETSVTVDFTADSDLDRAEYSINNGGWVYLEPSHIIDGLSAGTTYNFKIRVRRADSQLWTESSTVSQTTIAYPSFASQPTYSARTETSLDVYYRPDKTIGQAQYRYKTLNGNYTEWADFTPISGEWNTTAGCTFRIDGLTNNTNYVVQMRIKSNISDHWTYSNEVSSNMYTIAYPSFANQPTFNARTETTLDIYYKPNMTIGQAQYQVKAVNGSYGGWHDFTPISGEWNTTAGCVFRISGLTPNTSYIVQMRIKSNISNHWTYSNEISTDLYTYKYPYVESMTQSYLTIGEEQTLNLYNPLNRTVTIKMYKNNTSGQVLYTGTGSGTTHTFTPDKNTLYASIPNETEAYVMYSATYDGVETPTVANIQTYKINPDECYPTFTNFEYEDTDSTTLALTNNNKILVNGHSNCLFKISTANKAVGKYSSSIVRYLCYWGESAPLELNYSSSEQVSGYVFDSSSNTLKVTAIDSRGLSTTVTKTVPNIPYVNTVINNIETQRKNGVDSKTYLKGKFSVYNGSWNASDDDNSQNRLKYVGYSVYVNNAWSEYYDITNQVLNKSSISESGNTKIYEFTFNDELEIHANGSSGGFDIGTEYQIRILIKDGNSSTIFYPYELDTIQYAIVTDGTVLMCYHKDRNKEYHIGLNGMSSDTFTAELHGTFNAKAGLFSNGEPVNNIGRLYQFFGDVMGDDGGLGVTGYSKVTATEVCINNINTLPTWKLDIETKLEYSSTQDNYYTWGYSLNKLSNLLNSVAGKGVQFDESLRLMSSWDAYGSSGSRLVDKIGYGTTFEKNSNYLVPARYYNQSGSVGSWGISTFENGSYLKATIYLKEV